MKRRPSLSALLGFAIGLFAPAPGKCAHVNVIELDNQIISPVTQQYIEEAIGRSESDGAACLVVQLDTPGGLLDSTRSIVKRIMNATVPVVVYVAPSGSRAGSAGVFITLAAHVAAMAPSTNIGAAHPVDLGQGENIFEKFIRRSEPGGQEESGKPEGEKPAASKPAVEEEWRNPLADKIMNDTVAWITTIAKTRGRNEEWAKRAVTESVSVTETEAVEQRIVDLIAVDLPDLLSKIDGRTVQLKGRSVELKTAGAAMANIPMNARQRFLSVVTNPNVAYLLMMLGTLGLIFEFTHPGAVFPGIAGFICLLLALYSFQTLPISYAALAILAIGLILLVAEIKVLSHGFLALGGVICLILGSVMLFESPDAALRVSLSLVLPAVGTLAAITLLVVQRALSSQAFRVVTGVQGLIGLLGEASTDLEPGGLVFVHGETWSARSPRPIRRGEAVRVTKVEGLRLLVEPVVPHHEKGEL